MSKESSKGKRLREAEFDVSVDLAEELGRIRKEKNEFDIEYKEHEETTAAALEDIRKERRKLNAEDEAYAIKMQKLDEREAEVISEQKKYEKRKQQLEKREADLITEREKHEKTISERKKHKRNVVMTILRAILEIVIGIIVFLFPILRTFVKGRFMHGSDDYK